MIKILRWYLDCTPDFTDQHDLKLYYRNSPVILKKLLAIRNYFKLTDKEDIVGYGNNKVTVSTIFGKDRLINLKI